MKLHPSIVITVKPNRLPNPAYAELSTVIVDGLAERAYVSREAAEEYAAQVSAERWTVTVYDDEPVKRAPRDWEDWL